MGRVGPIYRKRKAAMLAVSIVAAHAVLSGGQASVPLPADPLTFGAFTARFLPDGTFALEGEGWPPFKGTWKAAGQQIELVVAANAPEGCGGPGRYQFRVDGRRVSFDLVADGCEPRRMILDHIPAAEESF